MFKIKRTYVVNLTKVCLTIYFPSGTSHEEKTGEGEKEAPKTPIAQGLSYGS